MIEISARVGVERPGIRPTSRQVSDKRFQMPGSQKPHDDLLQLLMINTFANDEELKTGFKA